MTGFSVNRGVLPGPRDVRRSTMPSPHQRKVTSHFEDIRVPPARRSFSRVRAVACVPGLVLGLAAVYAFADETDTGWRYSTPPENDTQPRAETPAAKEPSMPRSPEATASVTTATAAEPATPVDSPSPVSDAVPEAAGRAEELLLEIELNGRPTNRMVLALRDPEGRVLLAAADFEALGLRLPDAGAVMHDGTAFHALEGLEDVTHDIDMSAMAISIDAPAAAMEGNRLSGRDGTYVPPDEPAGGVFLTHDLVAQVDASETNASGIVEAGAFGGFGSLGSTQVFRDLGGDPEMVRLETTWRKDFPESMRSLRAGDAIGVAGAWGRPVRFGGIQWGTNFATRPDFVTFPLPTLAGETALPSTIDIYINNSRRLSREIPAGPFTIDDVPAMSGSGDIELVVRDILGRETTIVQPYYASSRLLRDGLYEYSHELGVEREEFGRESMEYGRIFGVTTHRLGLTDYITGELRAEAIEDDQQTAGLAFSALWPATGVWSLALAGSRRGDETGGLLSAGFERQGRRFGLGARLEVTDAVFRQVGLAPDASAPGRTARVFASSRIGGSGSVAVSYVDRFNRDDDDVRFAQSSVSWGFGRHGSLRASVLYPLEGDDDTTFALGFSRALGDRRSLHSQATTADGRTTGELSIQKNVPPGPGSGYALTGTAGDRERLKGRYVRNTRHGAYTVEAESANGEEALRAGMAGSLVWVGGRPMMARDLGDAFAVVEVPGQAGIDIYRDNQIIGRTGSDGRAIVHGLLPYDRNTIRIDATQLPLDVQPGATEWRIVPSHGGAVRVRAEAERTNGAVFRILGEDGEALPAGTVITRNDAQESFPVGYDGLAYVTGLDDTTQLRARWDDHSCTFELTYPTGTDEPLPDLGDVVCRHEEPQ